MLPADTLQVKAAKFLPLVGLECILYKLRSSESLQGQRWEQGGAGAHVHFLKVSSPALWRLLERGRGTAGHLRRVAGGAARGVQAARLLPSHLATLTQCDDLSHNALIKL